MRFETIVQDARRLTFELLRAPSGLAQWCAQHALDRHFGADSHPDSSQRSREDSDGDDGDSRIRPRRGPEYIGIERRSIR